MEGSYLYPQDWVETGNRTSKPITITYDGRAWTLPPYPATRHIPRIVADRAMSQHVIMGTEDPSNPRSFESLVFVRWGGDRDPMPETPAEQSDAIERIDRSLLPKNLQKVDVQHYGKRARPERPDADTAASFDGR